MVTIRKTKIVFAIFRELVTNTCIRNSIVLKYRDTGFPCEIAAYIHKSLRIS